MSKQLAKPFPTLPFPYSDGCGRTGAFMSVYSTIDRFKVEAVLDVFQCVKAARIQRMALVTNVVGHCKCTCVHSCYRVCILVQCTLYCVYCAKSALQATFVYPPSCNLIDVPFQ